MVKGKRKPEAAVNRAAIVVGHALGRVTGAIDSFKEQHPHPVDEAREAIRHRAGHAVRGSVPCPDTRRLDHEKSKGRGTPDEEGGDTRPQQERAGRETCHWAREEALADRLSTSVRLPART